MVEEKSTPVNPLLARVRIPGETFRLPSLGLFYKNGELDDDVVNGELHVFPMTTIDEIVFKTPDRLFTGDAITEVFSRCIPQVKQPLQLLSKDVDYLMACLRLVTYGHHMEVNYIHSCQDAKEHTYKIEVRPFLQRAKQIDPTTLGTVFVYMLPNGQKIHFRPPIFASVIRLSQTMDFSDASMTPETMGDLILDALADMIESVDTVTDRAMIREWLGALNAGWIRDISDTVSKISDWGANFKVDLVCQDCGMPFETEISTNPLTFFM